MNVPISANNNKLISALFYKMAFCYSYIENGKNSFRARAYENAAKILNNMKEDVSIYANSINQLDEIKGIGKSIAEKIIEFIKTGKILKLEQLQKKIPFECFSLINIKGFGPKSIHTLYQTLKFKNRNELIDILENNKAPKIKGIGNKKLTALLKEIKETNFQNRIKLNEAQLIGNKILEKIKIINGVGHAEIAGSIRRKVDTIGDIDIVIQCERENVKRIILEITKLPEIKYIQTKGTKKISLILHEKGIQVDIQLANKINYGAALLYFTGSKEHNITLRRIANSKGLKLNEYGIFDIQTNKRIGGETEKEIYRILELNYILPENRKSGNIKLSFIKNSIPQ